MGEIREHLPQRGVHIAEARPHDVQEGLLRRLVHGARTNRQFAAANNRPVEVEREGESQPGHGGGFLRRLARARAHTNLFVLRRE